MQTKTLQQTVTFKASPHEVYDILMDSKKHQSLSGEPAKISKKVRFDDLPQLAEVRVVEEVGRGSRSRL